MRINRRGGSEQSGEAPGGTAAGAPAPKGPWSDLPPTAPAPRTPLLKPRQAGSREPIINNWRGLLIVLFLLFLAPFLARVASALILGMIPGH